ncbi:hypothetical protein TRFO_28051 [Tritrichomonas foetus]|uniref:Uncharacterized protein n=1 Tax=Tritrichomonas foetus TaxID=1144522 RepID=A0A1J4K4Q9_9EUKA|nr:hypothetical protein TRFO_28051 [Tritrichomonas foetus]|eukprot:OHT04485.1 hypothetical protein TRFO_28051 [Tritrichomonas foetus]
MKTASLHPSAILLNALHSRKKNFSRSLKKILSSISNDELIQKLALDEASSHFISNRIEEIAKSVFEDDREKYIESLLNIIHTIEKTSSNNSMYNSIHYYNYENASSCSNNSFQASIANAIIKQSHSLSENDTEALMKIGGVLINNESMKIKPFDPNQPDTYHIYAAVDLTMYSTRMKLIQTDLKTTKETMAILCEKMKVIMDNVKSKSIETNKRMMNKIDELEKNNAFLLEENKKLKSTIENQTIPELTVKIETLRKNYHARNEQKKEKIREIYNNFEECKNQLNQTKEENNTLLQKVNTMKMKINEMKQMIKSEKVENEKNQAIIEEKDNLIEKLNENISNLNSEKGYLSDDLKTLKINHEKVQAELVLNEHHNESLTRELNQLKDQLPKEKETNFAALTEIAELKTELEYVKKELIAKNVIINTFSKQNNELSTKLSSINHTFTIFKETHDTNQQKAQINENKLMSQTKKTNELKNLLNEAESSLNKNNSTIKKLKAEIRLLKEKVSIYEKQLSAQMDQMKNENNCLVGYEVTLHQYQSKINTLKESKVELQKQLLEKNNEILALNECINGNINIDDKNRTLILNNSHLQSEIERLKDKIKVLEKAKYIKQNSNQNEEVLKIKVDRLQTLNKQQELIINSIKKISPDFDLTIFHQTLAQLSKSKDFADAILMILNEKDYDSATLKITEMKADSSTMNRIKKLFLNQSNNDIIKLLLSLKKSAFFSGNTEPITNVKTRNATEIVK